MVFHRMPESGEAASAELEQEHHDWVCSIPTQAHVRAVSPGEAPPLALADANSMARGPPARLAKLRGDLARVEGSLPRSALQESWDADRWRKVTLLHIDREQHTEAALTCAITSHSIVFIQAPMFHESA